MLKWPTRLLPAAAVLVHAQFPPKPENVTVLQSKHQPGVTISYKEPGICETTPGVKSYAGYVHLPIEALNEASEHNAYPINTFYWFFESRKDPKNAPLAIWLNGGPGSSSLHGALTENGPCFIGLTFSLANDSRSTYLNPWSWNNEANILFIDQPTQVGYSYDTLTNVTVNLAGPDGFSNPIPADFSSGIPEQNSTFLVGTMAGQSLNRTANSTQHAAIALWHFAQVWFEEFPHYKPNDEQISLFTESYGGHFGPSIMEYWSRQNQLIANGTIATAHYLHLSTLGIINGCVDAAHVSRARLEFSYHNTYGIEAVSRKQYEHAVHEFERPGGVLEAISSCRKLQQSLDPFDHGNVDHVNEICASAASRAIQNEPLDINSGYFPYDITHTLPDSFPAPYMLGWLNSAATQAALGVPVNHTAGSAAVAAAFSSTGDTCKGGQLEKLAYLLDHGVRVVLFYGDRDYKCNWIAGEQTALSIPWSHQDTFVREAGYQPVSLSYPYTQSAGLVRQVGNLSFVRVYAAGHMLPAYQGEAAFDIFMRAIRGRDIATGEIDLSSFPAAMRIIGQESQYITHGPNDTWHILSDVLPQAAHECYVLEMALTCTEEEQRWIRDGSAIIRDWVLVGRKESPNQQPSSSDADRTRVDL